MNGNRIRKITLAGLFYLDDSGTEQFIDFAACYETALAKYMEADHLKEFQALNHYDDNQLQASIQQRKNWKVVGERNLFGEPEGTDPFIQFYTVDSIRFSFSSRQEFHEVRIAIERNGWRTSDRA